MKSAILIHIFCLFAFFQTAHSQDNHRNQSDVVSDRRIYMYYDETKKEIKYFTKKLGNDGASAVKDKDIFSLKRNTSCNIYFRWLNPLNYRIAFKDTVYVSPSDVKLEEYIKTYLGALNTTPAGSDASKKSLETAMKLNIALSASSKTGYELITDKSPFANKDLNLLLIQLLNSKFETADSETLNEVIKMLHALEDQHKINYAEDISKDFDNLQGLTSFSDVSPATKQVSNNIKQKYEESLKTNEEKQKELTDYKITLSNKPLEAFTKIVTEEYLKEVKAKVAADRILIQKLSEINQLMINSAKSSEQSKDFPDYFLIKSITFESNQNFETSFTVSKFETDIKKFETTKKNDVITKTIILEKYEPVKIKISTGIFYTNYELKSFGISTGTPKATVTEENIKSNTAIPATFVNFLFDIGSRNALPIFQIGADPTKKRPFLLFGGGLAIPSTRFAVTYGRILTWDAKLTSLKVGGDVESTTQLEKDIKYSFDMKSKGWYLGLQYNF